MSRFVERVGTSDRVIVVGTPLYRKKYDNNEPMRSFVVAAEGDLIGTRMIRTEAQKESVLPVLREGTEESAFPHLLQGRVYADFRKSETYVDARPWSSIKPLRNQAHRASGNRASNIAEG